MCLYNFHVRDKKTEITRSGISVPINLYEIYVFREFFVVIMSKFFLFVHDSVGSLHTQEFHLTLKRNTRGLEIP